MAKKDNTNLIIGLVAVGLLVVGVALYLSKHHSKQGACSVSASAASMEETCSDAEQTCKTYTKDKACNNDSCCALTTS